MFRLAGINDENSLDSELYQYLSSAISKTIKDCIDEFLDDIDRFDLFFQYSFSNTFFEGLSQYVKPKALCPGGNKADEQTGYEFTFAKMKRMREKMMDQIEFYTFDVFEERILYFLCCLDKDRARTASGKKKRELLKDKVEAARLELSEKYKLKAKEANDYSRKMYYASAMLLKESEDDNIIFWDYDFDIFFEKGFIKGINDLKGIIGLYAGYGYEYTCDIFSDVGIKPPLLLLGSKEANRIINEEDGKKIKKSLDLLHDELEGMDDDDILNNN